MQKVLHRAEERGSADFGWLQAKYSFSFGNWYNPARMGFGTLRVLNDDTIFAGGGFPPHSHSNMEIVTIVTGGTLWHEDNMGNVGVISMGEIQHMSAGTGVTHTEQNKTRSKILTLFQIWIEPKVRDAAPKYLQRILEVNDALHVHESAWISKTQLGADGELKYRVKHPRNGIYLFVVFGTAIADDTHLAARDALGIWDADEVRITSLGGADLLLLEVPMR